MSFPVVRNRYVVSDRIQQMRKLPIVFLAILMGHAFECSPLVPRAKFSRPTRLPAMNQRVTKMYVSIEHGSGLVEAEACRRV